MHVERSWVLESTSGFTLIRLTRISNQTNLHQRTNQTRLQMKTLESKLGDIKILLKGVSDGSEGNAKTLSAEIFRVLQGEDEANKEAATADAVDDTGNDAGDDAGDDVNAAGDAKETQVPALPAVSEDAAAQPPAVPAADDDDDAEAQPPTLTAQGDASATAGHYDDEGDEGNFF